MVDFQKPRERNMSGRHTDKAARGRLGRYVRDFDRDPDPYLAKRKVSGSAVCAACQRVRDKVPAAYLSLRTRDFLRAHGDEVTHLIHNFEKHERAEHPQKRTMSFKKGSDEWSLTFTDAHLARGIAEGLRHAYQGEVDLQCTPEDVMLRATWTR
jgi:hypothetical protein